MKEKLILVAACVGVMASVVNPACGNPLVATLAANIKAENPRPNTASTPFPIRDILPQLKGKTQVRIFLPSSLPFSNKVYFKNQVTANGYRVEFNHTPNCGGTFCYIGAIKAEKGGQMTQPIEGVTKTFKNIQLSGGVKAIFYNGCGAYCTALVEWQSQGVVYQVTMKNGREDKLTQIANSAIAAGSR